MGKCSTSFWICAILCRIAYFIRQKCTTSRELLCDHLDCCQWCVSVIIIILNLDGIRLYDDVIWDYVFINLYFSSRWKRSFKIPREYYFVIISFSFVSLDLTIWNIIMRSFVIQNTFSSWPYSQRIWRALCRFYLFIFVACLNYMTEFGVD